jgi:hypothetical protein
MGILFDFVFVSKLMKRELVLLLVVRVAERLDNFSGTTGRKKTLFAKMVIGTAFLPSDIRSPMHVACSCSTFLELRGLCRSWLMRLFVTCHYRDCSNNKSSK